MSTALVSVAVTVSLPLGTKMRTRCACPPSNCTMPSVTVPVLTETLTTGPVLWHMEPWSWYPAGQPPTGAGKKLILLGASPPAQRHIVAPVAGSTELPPPELLPLPPLELPPPVLLPLPPPDAARTVNETLEGLLHGLFTLPLALQRTRSCAAPGLCVAIPLWEFPPFAPVTRRV